MKWQALLLAPLAGFTVWPLAALVPAALAGAAYVVRRRPSALVAALLWTAYAVYESLMKARILCSGECNIRVDLLLVMPILWIAAIVAAVQFFRTGRPRAAP